MRHKLREYPTEFEALLGSAVQGYREGQRVIAGAITPSGYSNACLAGACAQALDDIEAAYELFANQRDGVLKVAITP